MKGKWVTSDKRNERRSFINPSLRLSAINQSQHYSALTSDPRCSFISTWWASLQRKPISLRPSHTAWGWLCVRLTSTDTLLCLLHLLFNQFIK